MSKSPNDKTLVAGAALSLASFLYFLLTSQGRTRDMFDLSLGLVLNFYFVFQLMQAAMTEKPMPARLKIICMIAVFLGTPLLAQLLPFVISKDFDTHWIRVLIWVAAALFGLFCLFIRQQLSKLSSPPPQQSSPPAAPPPLS